MAVSVVILGRTTGQSACSKAIMAGALSSVLPVKTCQVKSFVTEKMGMRQICMKGMARNKPYIDQKVRVVMSSESSSDITPDPLSPADTINQFYNCINKKDLSQLCGLISDDCFFDDRSFFKPFQGKKEVMDFLGQLIDGMGQNIGFNIGLMCGGDDFTMGVTWHLEWNKIQIPFTRGCSFYEFSKEETKLVIKRAQVVIESPVKPGHSSLVLLKIVTSLFDTFPDAAEWFLKSSQVILQIILKVYNMFLGPFISPIIAWYTNYWKFMKRILTIALKLLVFISMIFFKKRT